jgi:ElaB/YqjD/DUF883 family membrane-anchored ribosome-binding protein
MIKYSIFAVACGVAQANWLDDLIHAATDKAHQIVDWGVHTADDVTHKVSEVTQKVVDDAKAVDDKVKEVTRKVTDTVDAVKTKVHAVSDEVKNGVDAVVDQTHKIAGQVTDFVDDIDAKAQGVLPKNISEFIDKVDGATHDVADKVNNAADSIKDTTHKVADDADRYVDEFDANSHVIANKTTHFVDELDAKINATAPNVTNFVDELDAQVHAAADVLAADEDKFMHDFAEPLAKAYNDWISDANTDAFVGSESNEPQLPPSGSVNDYRWLANAVYFHELKKHSTNKQLAQEYLDGLFEQKNPNAIPPFLYPHDLLESMGDISEDQNKLDGTFKYTVLESFVFTGNLPKFISLGQMWNAMLVEQKRVSDGSLKYILAFEGTNTKWDWVADFISADGLNLDTILVNNMKIKIQEWIKHYKIDKIEAMVGHSAGSMWVKSVAKYLKQDDEKLMKDTWLITFNGYDFYHTQGRKQIDIRATGDIVSSCLGAHQMITVFSTGQCENDGHGKNMGIIESHLLNHMNLKNVQWENIDNATKRDGAEHGYYNFITSTGRVGASSAEMDSCNKRILDSHENQKHDSKTCVQMVFPFL